MEVLLVRQVSPLSSDKLKEPAKGALAGVAGDALPSGGAEFEAERGEVFPFEQFT